MIQDKITPLLKSRMLEEIKLSGEKDKERGFLICIDEKGDFSPSDTCEGNSCNILIGDPRKVCKTGIAQGDFHTHPYLVKSKEELISRGAKIPDNILIKRMEDNIKALHERIGVKDITINSPTYDDLLYAFLGKCFGVTKGTVCTSSDIGNNKTDCWTAKDIPDKDKRDIYCAKANSEFRKRIEEEGGLIEKWIASVFDREIIDLKN